MRLAFVNPPNSLTPKGYLSEFYGFPLGFGYMAACLLREGHEVRIFDPDPMGMTLETMWEAIAAFKPDVVGITAITHNFMLARRLVLEAKRRLGCLVIMGGPHVTALPRSTLAGTPGLDAVIRGEGELPVLALARELGAGGKVDFGSVPGASFLVGSEYRETPAPEPLADIDSLPYPAREIVDLSLYQRMPRWGRNRTRASIISSRGCPSACTFCATRGTVRKYRARQPELFVAEMEHLVKTYGLRAFAVSDDNFTADEKRVAAICDLILKKGLQVRWSTAGRVNNLRDESLIRKMRSAGCRHVLLGIETGNQRISDLMLKGITLAQAEECCAKLRRNGMSYVNSFILGAEGETAETLKETIAFAKKLKALSSEFILLTPYPGSGIFERYYKDFDRPDTDWTCWCLPGPRCPYEPRQTRLSWAELRRWRLWANLLYYLDPRQLLWTLYDGIRMLLPDRLRS